MTADWLQDDIGPVSGALEDLLAELPALNTNSQLLHLRIDCSATVGRWHRVGVVVGGQRLGAAAGEGSGTVRCMGVCASMAWCSRGCTCHNGPVLAGVVCGPSVGLVGPGHELSSAAGVQVDGL